MCPGGWDAVRWPGIQGHEKAWDGEGHGYPWGLPVGRRVEPALGLGTWEQCRPRLGLTGGHTGCLTHSTVVMPRVPAGSRVCSVSQRRLWLHGSFALSPVPSLAGILLRAWLGLAEGQAQV